MKGRLICIVGETASGKDMVARYIQEKYELKPVCSYTNREPRAKEVNGREHWFVSKEEFNKIKESTLVAAYTKIEAKNPQTPGYEYCALLKDIEDADIYIVDPNGIEYLQSKFPDLVLTIIYINACKDVRKRRAVARDSKGEQAFEDRYQNEHEQFSEFLNAYKYDYLIVNENISKEELFKTVDNILIDAEFIK